MAGERYAILLEEDILVDARKFGDLVAPALELTKVEARLAVRKGRGIFLENLSEEHAQKIAGELEKEGIKSRLVSSEQMPPFPPLRKVTALEHGDDVMTYAGPSGDDRASLPWDAVLVASCGVVAREKYQELFAHVPFHMIPPLHKLEGREREVVRENLILKMSLPPPNNELKGARKPDSIFESVERKYGLKVRIYADLLTLDLGTWIRVPLEEVGYVYMAGGIKLGGAWGFQLLVNDLKERCRGAFTEMTLKLLEATDIRELVFPQVEEFTRYTQWVALKRYLWPSVATSSPSPGPPAPSTDECSSSASPEPEPPSTPP